MLKRKGPVGQLEGKTVLLAGATYTTGQAFAIDGGWSL
jgi:hypothetical protein